MASPCDDGLADLSAAVRGSGDGARLYGGRWNTPGRPLIYAAETAALAVLEVRVHLDLDWDMLPDDYVLVAIDTAAIVAETINEPPDDPRAIGDAWMESRRSGVLRVPSWIVPESYNVLINPAHPDAPSIQLGSVRPFQFDQRLWTPR
jgi:RES domain-containing protein